MEVTGVCRTAKMDFVGSIGADDVIDYTAESFSRSGRRWDRIVDVAATRSIFEVRRALTRDGVYTWVGGTTGTMLQSLVVGPLISIRAVNDWDFTFGWKPFKPDDVAALVELFETGKVKPVIDRVVPFDQALEALRSSTRATPAAISSSRWRTDRAGQPGTSPSMLAPGR